MTKEAQEYLEKMFLDFMNRFPMDAEEIKNRNTIYKLETNIDDCSGEVLGYTMDKLFSAGAKDVHYSPVYMKKNRPGWLLSVICEKKGIETLEKIIFKETTTIGIRRIEMERSVLKSEIIIVNTEFGEAKVKICELDGEKFFYPEYESVVSICQKTDKSYLEIYQMILRVFL